MNKPKDYPVQAKRSNKDAELSTGDITFGMLRNRVSSKLPVTDEMIRVARTKLERAYDRK